MLQKLQNKYYFMFCKDYKDDNWSCIIPYHLFVKTSGYKNTISNKCGFNYDIIKDIADQTVHRAKRIFNSCVLCWAIIMGKNIKVVVSGSVCKLNNNVCKGKI